MTTPSVTSRIFNISSKTADINLNGSANSNSIFYIPNFIRRDNDTNLITFQVLHAEVPVSFYLITKYNNRIQLNDTTIVIPIGNYNINSFMTFLRSKQFEVSYNSQTSKLTLWRLTPFDILPSSAAKLMGLNPAETLRSAPVGLGYGAECPFAVNFLNLPRINFRSNSFSLENYNAADKSSDMFLSLQNNANQNALILYENSQSLVYEVEVNNTNTLDIRITDDEGRFLDFNGADWYLCLRVDTHYINNPKGFSNFQHLLSSYGGLAY